MKAKLVKENLDFKRGIEPKSALGLGWEDYFKNFQKIYFSTPSPHGERRKLREEFQKRLAELEPKPIPMKWDYVTIGGGRYLTDNKAYELGYGLVLVTNNHFTQGEIISDGKEIASNASTSVGYDAVEILMKKAEALEEPMMEDLDFKRGLKVSKALKIGMNELSWMKEFQHRLNIMDKENSTTLDEDTGDDVPVLYYRGFEIRAYPVEYSGSDKQNWGILGEFGQWEEWYDHPEELWTKFLEHTKLSGKTRIKQ